MSKERAESKRPLESAGYSVWAALLVGGAWLIVAYAPQVWDFLI